MPHIRLENTQRAVNAIFKAVGCSIPQANQLADDLVRAILKGADSHGIILTPDALGDTERRHSEVRRFAEWVKSRPPADPARPVLMQGENGRATAAARRKNGIPLDDATDASLFKAARKVGIPDDKTQRLLHG